MSGTNRSNCEPERLERFRVQEAQFGGSGMRKTLIEQILERRNALSLKEFADLYSISYKTAFEMVSTGRIPAIRLGATWRLDPVTLASWLTEQTTAAIERNSIRFPRGRSHRRQGPAQIPDLKTGDSRLEDVPKLTRRRRTKYPADAVIPDLRELSSADRSDSPRFN